MLMEINKNTILYSVLVILIILLLLASLGIINFNLGKATTTTKNTASGDYNNLPEKCRPPARQDINSWKEHLGHHADLQECFKYFN